jgi:hypothetical protein
MFAAKKLEQFTQLFCVSHSIGRVLNGMRVTAACTTIAAINKQTCSDCLCVLMVRVPGYRTEMRCVSCEVRTEFMYIM